MKEEKDTLNRLLRNAAKKEVGMYSECWLTMMLGFAFVYSMYLCMTTAGMAVPIGMLSAICGSSVVIIWEERAERIRVMETHMQDWVRWDRLFGTSYNDALKGKYFRVEHVMLAQNDPENNHGPSMVIQEVSYDLCGHGPDQYGVRVEFWSNCTLKIGDIISFKRYLGDITKDEKDLGIIPVVIPQPGQQGLVEGEPDQTEGLQARLGGR